jgi:sigma-B regulation protein RsbU (phosphoserine phosphatase)
LNDDIRGDLLSGQFITVCACILDVRQLTLTCVCAGHHALGRLSAKRMNVVERIGSPGPAIGLVSSDMLRRALRPVTVELQPGDVVLAWTDGLSEATDLRGNEFTDFKLLASALGQIENGYDQMASRVINDARRFAEGQFADDVTLLALTVHEPKVEASGTDAIQL